MEYDIDGGIILMVRLPLQLSDPTAFLLVRPSGVKGYPSLNQDFESVWYDMTPQKTMRRPILKYSEVSQYVPTCVLVRNGQLERTSGWTD